MLHLPLSSLLHQIWHHRRRAQGLRFPHPAKVFQDTLPFSLLAFHFVSSLPSTLHKSLQFLTSSFSEGHLNQVGTIWSKHHIWHMQDSPLELMGFMYLCMDSKEPIKPPTAGMVKEKWPYVVHGYPWFVRLPCIESSIVQGISEETSSGLVGDNSAASLSGKNEKLVPSPK